MQKREKAGLTRLLTGKVLSILSIGAILFVSLFVVLQEKPKVQAATSSTLNFQARLLNSSGAIVADGYYNIEFKLYSASSGGSPLWTETWYDSNGVTAGNDNRIQVRSGYVSVYLGNQTSFPGTINWDQDLYLTMNVGGTTQSASPTWDGEMNPRLKLTAVPYAFRAGQLAKLTGSDTSTLDFATQTGSRSILLPDESGTLCIQSSSNCGFNTDTSITLQDAYNATSGNALTTTNSRDLTVTLADTATDSNMIVNIASGSSGRFAVQNNGTDVLGVTSSTITLSANVSVAGSNTLTVGTGTTTLGGSLLANGDATIGNATTDRLTVTSQILGASPLVFQGASDNGFTTTFTFAEPTANNTITFPDASGTVQLAPTSGSYLQQVPSSTAVNTVTPTANNVVGLTVNGTSGTAATAAIFNQSQAADGVNLNLTNSAGTQTNGLAITRNGAGTTTNLLNLTNTSGTATNALNISGTFTNYISATNLTVTNAGNADFAGTLTAGTADAFQVSSGGAVTAVGVNSGSGLLQGTGGLTLTGAISVTNNGASTIGLNTGTSTGAVNIGNSAAGAITLQSGTSTEVIGAANTTGTAGAKSLIIDSAATSTYNVVALQVANTDRGYLSATSSGNIGLYGTGTGALYLNYESGSGGVFFGSGAGSSVGSVSSAGNADFAGTLTAGTGDAFQVSSGGAVTAVGVNSGSGLLQGTGGLTLTGAISVTNNGASTIGLNTGTSTGAVNIGNSAAGAITLQSGTSTEVIGAANTTGTAGAKSLIIDSAATSTYNVVALQVANTDRGYLSATSSGNIGLYGTGTGALYLNYESGSGGVFFGSGAGSSVGSVSSAGNADFEGTLTAGTTNAFTVAATGDITTGGDLALNGGDLTSTVALNIGSGTNTALTLNSGTTGTINIGTDASAETINIGNTGAAVKTVYIGDSANANIVRIGSTTGGATTTIQGGSGGIVLAGTVTGAASDSLLCKNGSNQISTCGGNTLSGYVTLQNAYANGNSITTTDNRDVTISLADTATDADLIVDILGTGNTFEIRDGGSAFFTAADGGTLTQTFTGTSSTANTINATSLSTGSGLSVVGSSTTGITGASNGLIRVTGDVGASGTGGQLVYLAPDFSNVGAATTSYGIQNAATDSTAVANIDYGYYGTLTLTGNAAKVGAGAALIVSSSSTTADTLAGVSSTVNVTGAISTGTRTNYGIYSGGTNSAINTGGTTNSYGFYGAPATSGANSGGTQNLYGSYLAPSSTNSTAGSTVNVYGQYLQPTATLAAAGGTINQYGLYVANGTSSTNGTSTKYGLYVESPTGADSNYAAVFAGGNVGIGTVTPTKALDIQGSEANTNFGIRIKNTNSGGAYTTSAILLENDIANNTGGMFKLNSAFSSGIVGNLNANDLGFANIDSAGGAAVSGNISLFNQYSLGNIGLAAEGSTSSQLRVVSGSAKVISGSIDPAASTTVPGSSTKFLSELMVGDSITVNGETRTITAIASNTSLTVDVAFTDTGVDASVDRHAAPINIASAITGSNVGALKVSATTADATYSQYGGYFGLTANPSSAASALNGYYGLFGGAQSSSSNMTSGSLIGVGGTAAYTGSSTLSKASSFKASNIFAGGGTINNSYGVEIADPIAVGATLQNNFGLYINDLTAGSTDVGIYVSGAETYSLQLASNSGTAASGITFGTTISGTSANLYRSAADTLKTDDNFVIGGATTVGTNGSTVSCNSTTCAIGAASIDNYSAVLVDANIASVEATMPSPTTTTSGKVVYVTAADNSEDFTLVLNDGEATEINIAMRENTTATLIWNGNDWTAAGASSSTTLQSAYQNTQGSAGAAELLVSQSGSNYDGLTIRNATTSGSVTGITGALLEVQTANGSNLLSINNNATEYANNGGAENSTFTMWTAAPAGGTITQYSTAGDYIATGLKSTSVVTSAVANHGVRNTLTSSLTSNLKYAVSFAVRGTTNFTTLDVVYSRDGTNTSTTSCTTGQTVTTGKWTRITCSFTAPSSGITSSNAIFIRQSDATARTYYVDNLSVTISADVNHAADGSVDLALGTNWTNFGTLDGLTRDTSTIYDTSGSVNVDTPNTADRGVRNNLSITPSVSTQYLVTFYARSSNTFNDIRVRYSRDGGTDFESCVDYNTQSVSTSTWTKITCLFTTDSSAATDPDLIIDQPTASNRNFYVDALSVTLNTNNSNNVQVGGANKGGPTTLFTLDRGSSAPIAANNDAYLGSMYYDTTTGKIQCYEADGWGACGSAPDNIVNLNPEYAGAVLNGSGVGTMTADFCGNGGGLSVNTSLCASGEARNYYRWTSPQATQQTYSIYVTYQLPATFKNFESDDTVRLTARTDSTSNAAVTYEMYRSQSGSITQCGSGETTVVTSANTWQTVGINGNESTGCSFSTSSASAFVIFKVNVKANSNANAYVGTLSFTTTGN